MNLVLTGLPMQPVGIFVGKKSESEKENEFL